MNDDEIMKTIEDVYREHGRISAPYLQRKCRITCEKAKGCIAVFLKEREVKKEISLKQVKN